MLYAHSSRTSFVGGQYRQVGGETYAAGQMYVARRLPAVRSRPYPVVLVHGGHLTAACYESCPDGRPGWADFFAEQGFEVYLVDHPARGRSAYWYGDSEMPTSAEQIERMFTASRRFGLWPGAGLHSQWPGSGVRGDEVFDRFYASVMPQLADQDEAERLMRNASAALLDEIGPAIVVTHSQSGKFGWHIADVRPELVRALIAIEPSGPPFVGVEHVGPPGYRRVKEVQRQFGITRTPLIYEPTVSMLSGMEFVVEQYVEDGVSIISPREVLSRKLVNVSKVPVLVVTGEASYHADYDGMTVGYLERSGVDVTHLKLAKIGIRGNGHMMMVEANSFEIASALLDWLVLRGLASTEILRRAP
jgi:pimeloyl-ACP methyl ester carboxylesterase